MKDITTLMAALIAMDTEPMRIIGWDMARPGSDVTVRHKPKPSRAKIKKRHKAKMARKARRRNRP